jgi:hypothetical protein
LELQEVIQAASKQNMKQPGTLLSCLAPYITAIYSYSC